MVAQGGAFVESKIVTKVALQPHHCGNIIEAVKGQLNDMLLKYSEEIQGTPVSFSNLELPRGMEYGRLLGAQPWVHVDLRATVVIFRPIRGLQLKGMVNQVSDSHVSLLVYGMFNASLSARDLANHYTFDQENSTWESNEKGDIQVNDYIDITIHSFQQAHGVLNLNCVLSA
jgi:DNA-directed RNA polymerase I subunit RPA43